MSARAAVQHRVRLVSFAGVAVVVVLALVVVNGVVRPESNAHAFYARPASAPDRPGVLLRSEPFVGGIPDGSRAWRILYTTTRANGSPAVASGIVVASSAASARPQPVVVWAHGTTGYAAACAPSLTARPFGSGIGQDLEQVVRRHWVFVAPDYTGMGTPGPQPYLIGQGEARSVLDAVRATRLLKQLSVSNHTVVWGHSQGGGAALWAGQIQPEYAPDVALDGVAAIAPTSDMPAFVRRINAMPGGRDLTAYVVTAYSAAYPDVKASDYLKPAAIPLVLQISQRCGRAADKVLLSANVARGLGTSLLKRSPNSGPLGTRLRENTSTGTGATPLLLAQGGADKLIPPTLQRAYARRLCARGERLDYREYPGRDHAGVEATGAPLVAQLLTWTEQRLAGRPAGDNCARLLERAPAQSR